jgi:hypothetical protein
MIPVFIRREPSGHVGESLQTRLRVSDWRSYVKLRLGSADLFALFLESFQQIDRPADLGLLPLRLLRNFAFNG